MNILVVENDGRDIVASNYGKTWMAENGIFEISNNAGACRLLVPPCHSAVLMGILRSVQYVVVTRPEAIPIGLGYAIEVMFEDGTDSPFALHLSKEQVGPFFPAASDNKRKLAFQLYCFDTGSPVKVFACDAYFRVARHIPWMKPINPRHFR